MSKMQKTKESSETKLSFLDKLYRRRKILGAIISILIAFLAFYIRIQRIFLYGYYLDEADPYFMYWGTNYLVEHGISSWYTLTASNNATHIFWYPWGRDITNTDYPFNMMLAALTYPIAKIFGLSVLQWSVLQPPIAGALIVLFSYLLAREIGGELAGIFSAFIAAVIPGTLDRTNAGFFVKLGMVQPTILLGLFLFVKMIKSSAYRSKWIYTITSAIVLSLVAWSWGGYQIVDLILGIFMGLYPIVKQPEKREELFLGAFLLISLLVQSTSPTVSFVAIIKGAGLFLIGGYALYSIAFAEHYILGRTPFGKKEKLSWRTIYLGTLLAVGMLGLTAIYFNLLDISGRAYYFLGIETNNPLVASVSEHQTLSLSMMIRLTALGLLLSWVYFVYGLFIMKKQPINILFVFLVPLVTYMGLRASYLLMFVATMLSAIGGMGIAPISQLLTKSFGISEASIQMQTKEKKAKKYARKVDEIGIIVWTSILIFLIVIGGFQLSTTIVQARAPPLILSGGIGLAVENKAWIYALDVIKNETAPNSVFMPWWDYGYWIPVMTGRATVADGATINGTQIALLAQALTAQNENETIGIALNDFKAPANNTYIAVFDVFRAYQVANDSWVIGPYVSIYTGTVGLADIPKSIWMLRIGGRLNLTAYSPYFAIQSIPYQGTNYPVVGPNWTDPLVQSTLIYRMMIDAVYHMNDTSIMRGTPLDIHGNVSFIDFVSGATIEDKPFHDLQPFRIVVDPIYSTSTDKIFVAVIIYKITG
ncbi:MAG: STT3 domain-containing protein [Fervidicoccaceae archaeon]